MTKPDADVDRLAAERLAADEERLTDTRARRSISLGQAWRSFWAAPSPWMITSVLAAALTARVILGGGVWWELLVPVALVATFPFVEWIVHVCLLHWRPRRLGPVTIDPLVSRKHREHHADPRDLPLVFIPWQVLLSLVPALAVVSWAVMPSWQAALTTMASISAIGLGYEWTHYLIHSDYRPRSRWYRHVWRNHRLHHYKNEHYWFTVTSAGTSDRLFGTYPDPTSVPRSKTVRALHATLEG